MKRRHVIAVICACVVWLSLGSDTSAEPATIAVEDDVPLHILNPSTLTTQKGTVLQLDPGYFLTEEQFDKVDAELTGLQDIKTKLEAENAVLHESVRGWQPGWKTLILTLGTGLVGGIYVAERWL